MGYTVKEKHSVLAAACITIFVNSIAGSMLNLALCSIGEDFGAGAHDLAWVTSIYFIVSVSFLLPAARLADIYGKKRIFIVGTLITLGSMLMCSLSWDIVSLYVFRGSSGIGLAFLASTSVSMISDVYPRGERGTALGLNAMSMYIGATLGPSVGGFMTEMFGWRSIFLLIIPFMLTALLSMSRFGHNIIGTPGEPFDLKGSVYYGLAVTVFMFGFISLPEAYSFILIVIGTLLLFGFIRMENRVSAPIMMTGLFRNRGLVKSFITIVADYLGSYSVVFLLGLYLQNIGALSPFEAGIVMMVQPIVQVAVTPIAGRLSDRLPLHVLPSAGMAANVLGLCILMFLGMEMDLRVLVAGLAVLGAGYGMFCAPNTAAAMAFTEPSSYNKTSALISTMRQTGFMFSMGVATCVITVFIGGSMALNPLNYADFVTAMHVIWAIGIVVGLIGIWFAWTTKNCRTAD